MSWSEILRKIPDRFARVEQGAVRAFPRGEADEAAPDGAFAISIAPPLDLAAEASSAAPQAPASPRKMAFLLALGALVSKMLGFLREILMAQVLGASLIADGYRGAVSAVIMPLIFLQNESVPAILIPMHQAAQRRGGARRHIVSISCMVTLTASALMLAIQFFGDFWVEALLGGFSAEGKALTLDYVLVMSWAMPSSALLNALAAGEIAEGQTRISNLRASLLNLSMILGLVVYYFTGWLGALAWSFTLAFNGLAIWGLWALHCERKFDYEGLRPSHVLDAAKEFMRRLRPVLALPLAEQAQVWVERIAASRIVTGAVASLDYARTLSETALLLISQPVGLAYMASYKPGESHRQIEGIVRLILALTGPASAFAFVFAPDIVRLVFHRGAFSETGVLLTSSALRGISAGLWASTLGWILLRQLNSEGRNALATAIVVGAYLVNIAVNLTATWIGPTMGVGLFLVGLGETARSLTLLAGTIWVLPNRKEVLSLAPMAAAPALAMLACGWSIEAATDASLLRLAAGGAACILCTLIGGLALLPELRDFCLVRMRKLAAERA